MVSQVLGWVQRVPASKELLFYPEACAQGNCGCPRGALWKTGARQTVLGTDVL